MTLGVSAETLKTYDLRFYNVSLKDMDAKDLKTKWKFYLLDNEKVLYNKPTDKHKNDQFCSYSFEIDDDGRVVEDSIKLIKHKKNYSFNLKAFEFLRDFDFQLKAVNPKKEKRQKISGVSPRMDFIYLAF